MLLCIRIPDYPLAVARTQFGSSDAPLIVTDRYDRGRVVAIDPSLRPFGARAGQTATQAVAAASHARTVVYDAPHGTALWQEMLDALDAVTPLVDDVRPGIAFLDMRGIPGEFALWTERISGVLAPFGMPVHTAGGPNKFCAYAATWIGDGAVICAGEERARLQPLPLEVLDLDRRARERLQLLGVESLGELARLPHGPFVRRFGRDAAVWHDWARGIDRTPFMPRGHALAIEASMFGEGNAEEEHQVFFALRVLLSRIGADLQRCGKRASSLRLDVELENGETSVFDILLAAPTAEERAMLDVLRAKLEDVRFQAPVIGLRLRASRLEDGGETLPLLAGDDIDHHGVAVTLARLEAILGEPVLRAHAREAHPIEERFSYEPFALPKRDAPGVQCVSPLPAVVPQLRLLTVREIEVRVVRGEPCFVDERRVVECSGPWRIEEGWFSSAVSRDEYDVVLEGGLACRIYRQGASWYLRGSYD